MYRKIDDFLTDFSDETQSTLKVFNNLTDDVLSRSFHEDNRTLGRLAWHIVHTLGEMTHAAGLPLEPIAVEPELTVENLVSLYTKESEAIKNAVKANWKDDCLTDKIPMYGEEWKKGFVLSVLIRHEAHHRGQMTVLMRQAGLKVPGVYGPSKDEWAAMGMPAMA